MGVVLYKFEVANVAAAESRCSSMTIKPGEDFGITRSGERWDFLDHRVAQRLRRVRRAGAQRSRRAGDHTGRAELRQNLLQGSMVPLMVRNHC